MCNDFLEKDKKSVLKILNEKLHSTKVDLVYECEHMLHYHTEDNLEDVRLLVKFVEDYKTMREKIEKATTLEELIRFRSQ